MKKLEMSYMTVDFNQEMMCSIVSTSSTTLKLTALFRTYGDYGALKFYTKERNQHKSQAYDFDTDYTGTKLSFQLSIDGIGMSFSNTIKKPALTINNGVRDYYITLGFLGISISDNETLTFLDNVQLNHTWIKWNSEIVMYDNHQAIRNQDYYIDYVKGLITPMPNSHIPYGATLNISYQYCSQTNYKIDFDNLFEGEHPDIATEVPPYGIQYIMFPILANNYQANNMTYTGQSQKGVFTFSNWNVISKTYPDPSPYPYNNPYKFAEDYDDEYYQNPQRLIDVMYNLGYRESIVFYMGVSHYYDIYGDEGKQGFDYQHMIIDSTYALNDAFKEWFTYYCRYAQLRGFTKIIFSISMETLHMPDTWKQKMYDGMAGQTGWTPATSFFSPTNPQVRQWESKVINEILNIMITEGFPPILQLGEPWWWCQEFEPSNVDIPFPNKPPCFYDDYTVSLYRDTFGVDMPRFQSSNIDVNTYSTLLNWLQEQLGNYTDFIKNIVKQYDNSEFMILFFPPSVLDTERVSEAMRIVNVPMTHWQYPNLDRIQIEDYDWLIQENINHQYIYGFAEEYFHYPTNKIDYFAGFAWDKYKYTNSDNYIPISYQWNLIENAARYGLKVDYQVYIWAGTQIRRTSFTPNRMYYSAYLYIEDSNEQTAYPIIWYVEYNGGFLLSQGLYEEDNWHRQQLNYYES